MGFELTDEQQALRDLVRDFAKAEITPHAADWDRTRTFPVDLIPKLGDLGLFGLTAPEQYGGAGGRLHVPLPRRRRARPRRPVHRHHAVGRGRSRHQPDPHLRQRRAARPVAARPRRRTRARRVRTHRAGRRHRRRRDAHPRRAARRRVGHQRREGVHHQLRHPDHVVRHDHCAHRRARRRTPRDLDVDRARPAHRASPSSPPTTSSAGTRPTPTGSPSTTAACPRTPCSVPAATGCARCSASSTTDASRSPHCRSG